VHAALQSPADRATTNGSAEAPRIRSASDARFSSTAATALAIAALLVVVSVSLADGLLSSTVAYERDTTVFYFPLMSWAAQQLHQGIFPLWTPQFFGGYPLFADGEIGLAYPPALLALLTLAPERALVALRLMHLWVAALGTFALVRAWQLPRSSAVLAGTVFALGSFLQAQIHHENIVRTAAWLPLLLAFAEQALQATDLRRRVRWAACAVIVLGLAGLSLHSQMLAIDLLTLALYGLMRWSIAPGSLPALWSRRLLAIVGVCTPVIVLGLGLAAVQIVPLLELAGFSPRGSGIPYAESAAYSLTAPGLAQLIFPFLFRGPEDQQWGLWTHWESYIYIGLAPLVLAAVALVCARRRAVLGWAALGGVGLLLALGQYSPVNVHYLLWLLPGLSGLRAPGRFSVVVVLAGAMLSAYGLAWLHEQARHGSHPRARDAMRRLFVGLGVSTVGIAVLLLALHAALLIWPDGAEATIEASYLSQPRDTYALTVSDVYSGLLWSTDLANPHVLGSLLGLAFVLVLLVGWQTSPRPAVRSWSGWPAVLIALTACDLLLFAWGIHPRAPLAKLGAEPAAVAAIAQLPAPPDGVPPRLLASPVLSQVAANRLAPFGVQEANGYSSLQFAWHRDYLGRVLYADDDLLDLWSVRYVLDPARYGLVSSYRGVDFLAQEAQLHAPSGGAMSEATFALQPGSNVSELRFVTAMMGSVSVPQDTPVAQVELRDAAGQVVATGELLAGRGSMDWAAKLPNVKPQMQHQEVESAGVAYEGGPGNTERHLSFGDLVLDAPVQADSLTFRIVVPKGELALYGAAILSPDGTNQQLFGRSKAKFQQVYADSEIRVLENTAALPRAFLVASARTAPSLGSALGMMVHQPFDPRTEVMLAADSDADAASHFANAGGGGDASGSAGSVQVVSYSANDVRMHVSADQDALLVLTDTYYPGWIALVDNQQQPIYRGDVLFRVVPISAGEHDVDVRFEPTSVKVGLVVSATTLVLTMCAFVLVGRLGRRRRTTD
jgi:Bacterial membrane protein YfhO